jgi:hypothetical protein
MSDIKVHRCKCGGWVYEDQGCSVCDLMKQKEEFPQR